MIRVLTLVGLAALAAAALAQAPEPFRFPEKRHPAGAELKHVAGVPVLVVEGSPEDIGAAVGTLAVKPAPKMQGYPREILRAHKSEFLWPLFANAGNTMVKNFPDEYRREIDAAAESAGVSRDVLVVGNTLFDLKKILACSAVSVDGERSATGGPLLARNLDYDSLGYLHEYTLVTVYRPRGKHAFAAVGFPGLVGVVSGMNDAGLAVAVLEVFDIKAGAKRFDAGGLPFAVCYRKVLEDCATIAEAKKALEGMRRATTTNLAVADPTGVAVLEVSPEHVIERRPEAGVCVCTNHFCSDAVKPAKPWNVHGSFERFGRLSEARDAKGKMSPDDLRGRLDGVNLGGLTLQTMVFEPAALKLHLSAGAVPASKGPLATLDLKPLLRPGKK